jgi:hypothetical protein
MAHTNTVVCAGLDRNLRLPGGFKLPRTARDLSAPQEHLSVRPEHGPFRVTQVRCNDLATWW